MDIYATLAIGSFIIVVGLVVQNARRIRLGNVHELHPINLYDLARPTFEMWRKTMRTLLQLIWTTILSWSHTVSLSAARRLFELSAVVKGKRSGVRRSERAHRLWKEMAYEKDRLKAHFSYPTSDAGKK